MHPAVPAKASARRLGCRGANVICLLPRAPLYLKRFVFGLLYKSHPTPPVCPSRVLSLHKKRALVRIDSGMPVPLSSLLYLPLSFSDMYRDTRAASYSVFLVFRVSTRHFWVMPVFSLRQKRPFGCRGLSLSAC